MKGLFFEISKFLAQLDTIILLKLLHPGGANDFDLSLNAALGLDEITI